MSVRQLVNLPRLTEITEKRKQKFMVWSIVRSHSKSLEIAPFIEHLRVSISLLH